MRKEIEKADTVTSYICDFCNYASEDYDNIDSCPG